jgi:methylmalonyl-CoA mutase C-terminal domain/subunit
MSSDNKIRVLVAKPGLDGHDRGAKVIAELFGTLGWRLSIPGCARPGNDCQRRPAGRC